MRYRRTGHSGLKLPASSLGLMQNFGGDAPFERQRAIVRRAFDLGITHFDLANNYGPPPGSAEENFGRMLATDLEGHRDELVISTKAGYDMWPGPYGEWGSYQQDDRDRRKEARAKGLDKHHQLMIRTRIPGGIVSADAYLAHDAISERWANGTLRVTTRQDFQLHGVLKRDIKKSIAAINEALLTTLGGCGDVERNIMCCPEPIADRFHADVHRSIAAMVTEL